MKITLDGGCSSDYGTELHASKHGKRRVESGDIENKAHVCCATSSSQCGFREAARTDHVGTEPFRFVTIQISAYQLNQGGLLLKD